jgi:hypothetical protein
MQMQAQQAAYQQNQGGNFLPQIRQGGAQGNRNMQGNNQLINPASQMMGQAIQP